MNASYNASTYRVQNPSTPPDGSQQNLLKSKPEVERWPGESDFLASTWAFTLSLHSLWSLPIVIIQHGGLVFLLIYMLLLAILGAPLLLLEMFLGQYSGLAPIRVFRHLSPVLTGLGLAMCIQAAIRAVLELGVLMWMGQGMFRLFYQQKISDGLFSQDILNREDSSLEALGTLSTQLLLVLGIATLTVFVLVVAGTKSVGKVCMVTVPACFMIIVTLSIRACLTKGGSQGVLMFHDHCYPCYTSMPCYRRSSGCSYVSSPRLEFVEGTNYLARGCQPSDFLPTARAGGHHRLLQVQQVPTQHCP